MVAVRDPTCLQYGSKAGDPLWSAVVESARKGSDDDRWYKVKEEGRYCTVLYCTVQQRVCVGCAIDTAPTDFELSLSGCSAPLEPCSLLPNSSKKITLSRLLLLFRMSIRCCCCCMFSDFYFLVLDRPSAWLSRRDWHAAFCEIFATRGETRCVRAACQPKSVQYYTVAGVEKTSEFGDGLPSKGLTKCLTANFPLKAGSR